MKLKKMTKCMLAVIAAVIAANMAMTGSIKTEAAESVIDPAAKGSITIHKYAGEMLEGLDKYPSQKEMEEAVKNAGDTLKPLEGVVFKYTRIGEMGQYTKNGTVQTGFSVNTQTKAFLGLTEAEAEISMNGNQYYNTTVLNEALNTKTQTEIEEKYQPDGQGDMITGADGIAKVTELPTGLYLIYEYSYPSDVNVTTRPFFVSVPTTDDGKKWIYDVDVYPKNQTESIDISKWVASEHGEAKKTDAEIGEDITFKIHVDVPDNVGKMKTYSVKDTLGEGLDFVKEDKVYGVKSDGRKEELKSQLQYTFDKDGQNLLYAFHPAELADENKTAEYETLEITYIVRLNGKACVGKVNVNKAVLIYSRKTNVEEDGVNGTVTTEPVKASVYTYAVDILKYGNGDVSKVLKGVTFQLLDKDKKKINLTEENGIYYLDKNGQAVLTSDETGKIYVKGLETGTYYLRETETNKGYNLLKEDIKISITAEDGTYEDAVSPLKVKANYTMTDGNVKLKVNNTKGFLLPATGGAGAILFFVIGGLMVFAGICSFRISWKRAQCETE